jgi:hypothetical protein
MSTPPLHLWAVEDRWGDQRELLWQTIANTRRAAIESYNLLFTQAKVDIYKRERRAGRVLAVRVTVTVEPSHD